MALTPGSRLGPYEVVSALGAGGMGEVYRVTDTVLKRQVALKVLPPDVAADPDRLARFRREAEVLASLNHPNIAHLYGVEKSAGSFALVMELVEGPTLADRIAEGPIPIKDALLIAKQIAEALETAHEHGIIHRDLKPANIKLREDGTVKVLDFGLAKALDPVVSTITGISSMNSPTLTSPALMTGVGVILGTAAYMAPEQAKGRPADKRSDLWAFGCVLYEMLTSERPFGGEDVAETLAHILTRGPDWEILPSQTPVSVRLLLRRCLERDRTRRLDSALVARIELEATATESVVGVGPASAHEPGPLRRRTWKSVGMVAVAMLIGGLAAGSVAWTLKPERAQRVTRFVISLPEDQSFSNTGRQSVAVAPDGASLVYVANQRLYLRSLGSLEARAIAGSEVPDGISSPAFSPDGLSIAFFSSADRTLKRLAVAGGTPVTICSVPDTFFGINWDESGIVFGQGPKGILRVSPNGGAPEVIASVREDEMGANPQVLPGGQTLLFTVKKNLAGWEKGQVVVQPIGGTDCTVLVDGGADGRYVPSGHIVYAVRGVLYALPFDLRRGTVSGAPVPIVEGVRRANTTAGGTGIAQFSYSSSGVLAYLPGPAAASSSLNRLSLFDRTGNVQPLPLEEGQYESPRVSPDGKRVAFERDDGVDTSIWIYDLAAGGAARRLTFEGVNRAPVWSPDGLWLAFQSNRGGDEAIFRQRADGSGAAERLTRPDSGVVHTPQSWSPDGAHLLFSVQKGLQVSLWELSLSDQQVTAFGDVQAREAAFSPDGRWVAYQAGSGTAVFMEPFPRTGAKYLVPSNPSVTNGAGHPFWSPHGDEIIMNTGPNSSTVTAVRTSPQVSFGQPMPFARAGRNETNPAVGRRNADMMPDGQHVLGVANARNDDNLPTQINVVLNWFDELKTKVPTR